MYYVRTWVHRSANHHMYKRYTIFHIVRVTEYLFSDTVRGGNAVPKKKSSGY